MVTDMTESVQSSLSFGTAIKRLQMAMNDAVADVDEMKFRAAMQTDSGSPTRFVITNSGEGNQAAGPGPVGESSLATQVTLM